MVETLQALVLSCQLGQSHFCWFRGILSTASRFKETIHQKWKGSSTERKGLVEPTLTQAMSTQSSLGPLATNKHWGMVEGFALTSIISKAHIVDAGGQVHLILIKTMMNTADEGTEVKIVSDRQISDQSLASDPLS